MREKIVAANWKMNKTLPEAIELVQAITFGLSKNAVSCKVVLAPPYIYLERLVNEVQNIAFVSAQNCSNQTKGAFTGEVSTQMLASLGVQYCIVGHSERRAIYGEGNEVLKEKLQRCYEQNITPVFCIGELLEERNSNSHFEVVAKQLQSTLFTYTATEAAKTVLAYEPVWAIGTGLTATPEQAQEMHGHIRSLVATKFGAEVAENITILYGGSCNAQNAAGLFVQPDIDGGLIGGAALIADDFLKICHELR